MNYVNISVLLSKPVFSKSSVHGVTKSCMGEKSIQREMLMKIHWSALRACERRTSHEETMA